jgi:AcrR family transcriptional regulator
MNAADPKRTKRGKRPKKHYHHGNLREALLEAGEAVLRRDGVAGLAIRVVTREAGVSHTAAKPHFGDADGFRAELAAVGYRRLAEAIQSRAGVEPLRARRMSVARAYVEFARDNTALFHLMFRNDLLDMRHPALVEATALAIRAMAGPVASQGNSEHLTRAGAVRIAAAWAYVHGLAILLVEKRLRGIQKRAPDFAESWDLVEAILNNVTIDVGTA